MSFREGDETETRAEAYGDPIPKNVTFLDQKLKEANFGGLRAERAALRVPKSEKRLK